MSTSSNARKFLNRRPLFTNKSSTDCTGDVESHVLDGVVQHDRKRSRITCSVSSNSQEKNFVHVNQCSEPAHQSVTKFPRKDQDALQQDRKPACPEAEGTAGLQNINSDVPLNIRRKRSNKRTLTSDHDKKDIFDDDLWMSTVENNSDASARNIDNHVKYSSSQDSFIDLFATSVPSTPVDTQQSQVAISEVLSSPKPTSSSKCNSETFTILDFLDEDDSKLAELDVSGLISSYNSGCKDSEIHKPSQPDTPIHMDVGINEAKDNNTTSIYGLSLSEKDPRLINKSDKLSKQHVGPDVNDTVNKHNQVGSSDTNTGNTNYDMKKRSEELFYGLPSSVGCLIKKHKGIEKLYDWQNDCLNLPGVQKCQNLIYSLPTSGGKTLVAEILIMKEILCNNRDALLILPYVSIVQEKVRDMSLFAIDLEFLVEEYAASKGKLPPRKRRKKKSLYIATIEKANGLVNSLIEDNRLSEIGLVVVDELHMIGDGGRRGATLEMCLAKIIFCSTSTQIIGMSATLNNIADLQQFLNAEKYVSDFRPVELREFIKVEDEIFEVKNDRIGRREEIPLKRSRRVKHQSTDKKLLQTDPDHLSVLVQEVIPKYSCLLFCATKKSCENVAELLANNLSGDLKKIKVKEKHELQRSLKSNADGLCPVLRRVIPYGIAYHHSGLTMDERKLIEEAYSQGTLCLLTCTSTLAAGVNLPAKRVILRSPFVGMSVMSRSQYKQMIGRAGRAGIDTSGESIMILQNRDRDKVMNLINAPLDSCHSSLLHSDGQGVRSLVLSLIGLKICNSVGDIDLFTSKTLLAVQNLSHENKTLLGKVHENVEALVNLKLVKRWESTVEGNTTTRVEATALGRATFKGCVDVDRSPFIYDEVKRAQEKLVLANDLHLLYLVTTPDMSADIQPHWMKYLKQVSSLNSVEQKAGEFIGVTEAYLSRKVSGQGSKKDEQMLVVKRFYLTLMLYKIINEHSIWNVANTFDVQRGFLQNLFTSSTTFASCLLYFTKELPEFHNIMLLLETIVDKLSYTAVLELVPLMQIPGVKKNRAKQLYAAGYRNLQAVAKADPDTLLNKIEHLPKTQARLLVSTAKMLLLEKAEALQDEAADLIGTQNEINGKS